MSADEVAWLTNFQVIERITDAARRAERLRRESGMSRGPGTPFDAASFTPPEPPRLTPDRAAELAKDFGPPSVPLSPPTTPPRPYYGGGQPDPPDVNPERLADLIREFGRTNPPT